MEVDQELRAAQEALERAMQRKEEASKLALEKLRIELSEKKAEVERQQQAEQELRENVIKRAREKMQRQAEEEKQRKVQQKAEQDALERQLSIREEEINKEKERQKEIRKIQEAAFQIELEARQIESDMIRAKEVRSEPEPVTLHSPCHPLSFVLGVTQQETPVTTPVFEKTQPAPVLECGTNSDKRKPQGQRYIDILTSKQIEEHIKRELGVSANPTRCDQLSAEWNEAPLMDAVRTAVAHAKERTMSHDALFSLIESKLEAYSV